MPAPTKQRNLDEMPDFLRLGHVAQVLGYGVSRFTVEDLEALGIPFVRRGKQNAGVRVAKVALRSWMEQQAGKVA